MSRDISRFFVLCFRNDEDWRFGVGVLPEGEEVLIGRFGFGSVFLHRIGADLNRQLFNEIVDVLR